MNKMSRVSSSSVTSNGFGCFGLSSLLLVAFIVLKLAGYIDWSWWWVVSPMIIYGVCTTIAIVVLIILYVIIALGDA